MTYDPDLFDAEILVDRVPDGTYTIGTLSSLLIVAPRTIQKRLNAGKLPRPAVVDGAGGFNAKHEWSRDQVIAIVAAEMPYLEGRRRSAAGRPLKPIIHGTEHGYKTHKRRGEDACDCCKVGRAAVARKRRHAAKVKASA